MEIKLARDITRKYVRDGKEIIPIVAQDWIFKKEELKIYITSEMNDTKILFSTSIDYLNNIIFNEDFNINKNKLEGSYYLSSIGLISENKFYEAEDLIEEYNTKIPEKDLEKGRKYISNKGRGYLYIGKLNISLITKKERLLEKENITTHSYLYDLNNKRMVKLSSIKLVSFVDKDSDDFHINFSIDEEDFMEDSRNKEIIYKNLNTRFENISFPYFNFNRINNLISYKTDKVEDFIYSEAKSYILEPKERAKRIHNDYYGNVEYIREDGSIYYRDTNGNVYLSQGEMNHSRF